MSVVMIWYKEQNKVAILANEGRKYNQFIALIATTLSTKVRVVKLPKERGYRLLEYENLNRAKLTMATLGKQYGITKGAAKLLKSIK